MKNLKDEEVLDLLFKTRDAVQHLYNMVPSEHDYYIIENRVLNSKLLLEKSIRELETLISLKELRKDVS